jgi:hypothetical protein
MVLSSEFEIRRGINHYDFDFFRDTKNKDPSATPSPTIGAITEIESNVNPAPTD